jgi:hypothetical protein
VTRCGGRATTTATFLYPITAPSLYERRAVMGVLRTTTIAPLPHYGSVAPRAARCDERDDDCDPTLSHYGSVALRAARCDGRATTTTISPYPITAPSLYERRAVMDVRRRLRPLTFITALSLYEWRAVVGVRRRLRPLSPPLRLRHSTSGAL